MPNWVAPLIQILTPLLLGLIYHGVKTPKDHERAQLLTTLAESAAAVVVNIVPAGTPWAQLLQQVVARIAAESTVPTDNQKKIENAATAALAKFGKTSNGTSATPVGK